MRFVLLRLAGIVASGALFALSQPPAGFHQLGWVAYVPLLAVVRKKGFLAGFLGGVGSCLVCSWLATTGILYRTGTPDGLPGWTTVGCFLFGCVLAVVAGLAGESKEASARSALVLAAVAVLLEALLLLVLPAHLALTQYRVPAMLWLASITGIWGVSFVLWAVNLWLAFSLSAPQRRWRAVVVPVGLALAALIPLPGASGPTLRVAAIQTEAVELDDLARHNARAAAQGAEMAVWPEFSAQLVAPEGNTEALTKLSRQPEQTAFVTTFRDDVRPLPHNTAVLFSGGRESQRYFKRKPFGGESKMHAAGTAAVAARLGNVPVGLNVCYDSCFPHVMRDTATAAGSGIIALPTIDPASPYGFVAAIHSAYTPFRAAELGVAVVRADASAYSHIVGPDGRIVSELGPGVEGVLVSPVVLGGGATVYRFLGDWFLVLCALLVLATVVQRALRRRGPIVEDEKPVEVSG